MSTGDVKSDKKGSGARFNDGKVSYELIPIRIFANQIKFDLALKGSSKRVECIYNALLALQHWQEGGDVSDLYESTKAMLGDSFGGVAWDECARVFEYGVKKYAEWNWLKGMQWSVPLGCAVRHLEHIYAGEELDHESGLRHRGHFLCNVCMLIMYADFYKEGDNRPPMLAKKDVPDSDYRVTRKCIVQDEKGDFHLERVL